jgi:hypothetical protein
VAVGRSRAFSRNACITFQRKNILDPSSLAFGVVGARQDTAGADASRPDESQW